MKHRYFDRDLSWLAFNYRVLQEAQEKSSPLYERIKFLAIYASNLEEFYKVRVAEHRSILTLAKDVKESKRIDKTKELLRQIHKEVTLQQKEYDSTFTEIFNALDEQNISICDGHNPCDIHSDFIKTFFTDEVLPFLQPVMVSQGETYSFLRDNRVYIAVRMFKKTDLQKSNPKYAAIKLPYAKVKRFIQLPEVDGKYYIAFLDNIIKMHLNVIFPGYNIENAHCIRVSRDADLMIGDEMDGNLANKIRQSLSRRKTGTPSRFIHEKGMPEDLVTVIRHAFNIHKTDVVEGGYYLALENLFGFPNPRSPKLEIEEQPTLGVPNLDKGKSIFKAIKRQDTLVQYPYHSYDYLIRFLMEASYDSAVDEIMITQYRVANNSAVVNSLISAAQNGKKVTVFVELKARFDEESNLKSAAMMEQAGVQIIYSIPNLKVHSKVALVLRRDDNGAPKTSYAYLSTGNFNEKTSRIYSDFGLFTCNKEITNDLQELFAFLNNTSHQPKFKQLLVAQFNLLPQINHLIDQEIANAKAGKKAHIIIKMNAIQDFTMIDKLYEASQAGVQIDMIIRGICCLVPGDNFSKNISITRIVDRYLEHSRIWYFYANGEEITYMGSPDWMKRNLYHRIETVVPILDHKIKKIIIHFLRLGISDNAKGKFINKHLQDITKKQSTTIRSQYAMYEFWQHHQELKER